MKYYEVIAKCGHVGKKFYIPIKFAVETKNKKEDVLKRVKHNQKDAILFVRSIRFDNFLEIKNMEKQDIICPRNQYQYMR